MRQILVIAAIILAGGTYAASLFDTAVVPPAGQAATVRADAPREPTTSRSLTIDSGRDGHFNVEARIDGRPIDFLIDTGASLVILRESDAARVGIRPYPSDYTATVSTANGQVKAARATLSRVEVGGILIRDVPALVLPDKLLGKNLLGMAFMSKLKRYEVAGGRLVLEQ